MLSTTHEFIRTAHPTLYTGGSVKKSSSFRRSDIAAYGWYANIVRCASGLDKINEVKQTNFHDWITYLAIITAEAKFKTEE